MLMKAAKRTPKAEARLMQWIVEGKDARENGDFPAAAYQRETDGKGARVRAPSVNRELRSLL
jgi:hypothetical protein